MFLESDGMIASQKRGPGHFLALRLVNPVPASELSHEQDSGSLFLQLTIFRSRSSGKPPAWEH